jgi:hypothetical protein
MFSEQIFSLIVFVPHCSLRKWQLRPKSERALISPEGWHFARYQPHHHLPTSPARATEAVSALLRGERMSQEGVDPVIQQLRWLQEVSNLCSEFARALFIKFVDLRNRCPHKLSKILYELPVCIGELVNV